MGGELTVERKKVAFFSPHAGIWQHALPESFLAKCLDEQSFEVSRIACDGVFNRHCTVMEAVSVGIEQHPARKEAVCKQCRRNASILRSAYAGEDHLISSYLGTEDVSRVDGIIARLAETDIRELTCLGVEVGRIAAYEVLIKFKKTSADFSAEERVYLETYVRNALLSLLAFSHIYQQLQPDILVAYSPQYAVLGVCARYCELQGKQVYFVEGSSNIDERYEALRVWDWTEFGLTNPAIRYWEDADRYTLPAEDISRVDRHFKRLLDASSFSVYSEPASGHFDLRAHFGMPRPATVVVAAMSSYDEVYSAHFIGRFPDEKYYSSVFRDQLEWISATIDFFAAHPELFLLIRIHPRTFPSRRNSVMAREQIELARILEALPDNVRANYPAEKISIYDLYPQIDALVTGWSATGVEAMVFDVPVVTYDRHLPSYPASIHYTGDSRPEYFENLLKAVSRGKSGAMSENGRRWMAYSMSLGVVRHPATLSDLHFVRANRLVNLIYRGVNKLFPRLLRKLEALRHMNAHESARFNELLKSGKKSLYDLGRAPE